MATNEPDNTNHNISESADKIRLETKVKRGDGTRDQDEIRRRTRRNGREVSRNAGRTRSRGRGRYAPNDATGRVG